MDAMAHFDRERIPERVVHAKGAGTCIYMLMRDAEGRKKEPSKVIQTTKQSKATQHTQGCNFSKKNYLPRVEYEPTILHTPDMYIIEEITYTYS